MTSRKEHWENIYTTKPLTDVSWYQPRPTTSLDYIGALGLPQNAPIIDVGGGDSFLVDHLLELGYSDITVLDISNASLQRAQKRLGLQAEQIQWVESDITSFQPSKDYQLWHDRAAFHFLTNEEDVRSYLENVKRAVPIGGYVIVGTFSENGPTRCSGIEIRQYSIDQLTATFGDEFKLINSSVVDHATPFDTIQNFTFCCFEYIG